MTQPVGDETEPVHAMMRKVIALFDEYQSKENAKHVIRSMKENARQGFWNGATTPLRSAGRRARPRNGAQPRPKHRQTATFAGVARQWLACAFRRFASLL